MAVLTNNQRIDNYEVIRLIKENNYCETYRVENESEEPFFLKLFILKNTPEKMLDDSHHVSCIDLMSKLRHKNIVSYVERGTTSAVNSWPTSCNVRVRCGLMSQFKF